MNKNNNPKQNQIQKPQLLNLKKNSMESIYLNHYYQSGPLQDIAIPAIPGFSIEHTILLLY